VLGLGGWRLIALKLALVDRGKILRQGWFN
jgi:hypothetical protein